MAAHRLGCAGSRWRYPWGGRPGPGAVLRPRLPLWPTCGAAGRQTLLWPTLLWQAQLRSAVLRAGLPGGRYAAHQPFRGAGGHQTAHLWLTNGSVNECSRPEVLRVVTVETTPDRQQNLLFCHKPSR